MPDKDSRYRFLLEKTNVRGVLVHLDDTWQEVLTRAEYPHSVQRILGHAMVAVPLLASTIKFSGKLTLQARGDGPVHLLVVQAGAEGGQRGLAKWTREPPLESLGDIFGDATLTIQIESSRQGEVYQGVVRAEGQLLQDALGEYFENSEQLPTRLWLHCSGQRASGLLLQQLPDDGKEDEQDRADNWRRVTLLADTVSAEEMQADDVSDLLLKVFAEDDVRLFESEPLRFQCGCSRQRTAALIAGLGQSEALDILQQQGRIEIVCEFCNAKNVFDSIDVEAIFRDAIDGSDPDTVH